MRLAKVLTVIAMVVALAGSAGAGALPAIPSVVSASSVVWIAIPFLIAVVAVVTSVVAWRKSVRMKLEKERMELVRHMAAGLLHEVRQPLQVVTSHLDLLALEADDDETKASVEKAYEGVRRVVEQFQRLEDLCGRGDVRTTPHATYDEMLDVSGEPR